jgi:glucosamine--fructose-6-phosphate aminotransferase (isomerizing)
MAGMELLAKDAVADRLVDGLRRMEYRGYDSAGVCTMDRGKLIAADAGQACEPRYRTIRAFAAGNVGIAHTRWATYGAPTANNAHRMRPDTLRLFTMGIIEISKACAGLQSRGRTGEQASEVVAHLISNRLKAALPRKKPTVLPLVRGAFALPSPLKTIRHDHRRAARFAFGGRLRRGAEAFTGSDALALTLIPISKKVTGLLCAPMGVEIFNFE